MKATQHATSKRYLWLSLASLLLVLMLQSAHSFNQRKLVFTVHHLYNNSLWSVVNHSEGLLISTENSTPSQIEYATQNYLWHQGVDKYQKSSINENIDNPDPRVFKWIRRN